MKTTQRKQNVWHYCDRNNAAMVAKGNRQIWRNRQIAGQLITISARGAYTQVLGIKLEHK